jgi:hypothetical protein
MRSEFAREPIEVERPTLELESRLEDPDGGEGLYGLVVITQFGTERIVPGTQFPLPLQQERIGRPHRAQRVARRG